MRAKRCACQLRLIDGKCPAGCEQFKRPAVRAQTEERLVRERVHRERVAHERIGLSSDAARDAYERSGVESGYSQARAQGAERARKSWAKRGAGRR